MKKPILRTKLILISYACLIAGAICFAIADYSRYQEEPPPAPPVVEVDDEVSIQSAGRSYGDVEISRITHIYDGDTFNVDIDKWPKIIGSNIGIRISGIDTPEKTDQNTKIRRLSQEAKAVLETMLKNAKTIELRNINRDKYFRINADIFADDVDVGQKLIDKGLAKPYDGGTKSVWTSSDSDNYFKGVKK